MSQFSDSRPPSALDPQSLPTSIFPLPGELQVRKQAVSNLTKNLMSSSARYIPPHVGLVSQGEPSRQPPLYSASLSSHGNFISANLLGSQPLVSNPGSFNCRGYYPPVSSDALYSGNANYIPLGHNSPTAVSSSYTSNYSHTPSFSSTVGHSTSQVNTVDTHNNGRSSLHSIALPGLYKAPAIVTTDVSMDTANPNISLHRNLHRVPAPRLYKHQGLLEDQLSNSFVSNGSENGGPIHPAALHSNDSSHVPGHNHYVLQNYQNSGQPQFQHGLPDNRDIIFDHDCQCMDFQGNFFNAEPGHYVSYKEYLDLLNRREACAAETDNYQEHFNIVDFSVDELITMLACLLTKIIDTNDKLHPNHFDNTIAARQKLKEQRKLKKVASEHHSSEVPPSYSSDGISTTVSSIGDGENTDTSSDEEKDELKNRYLANVLAFHGTNVPGISLHAYLTRVLKYCPVTNEVFLSLLVYFDRIAKRANNLPKKKKEVGVEFEELEQLFVMDSYNIHRLIILGITVSSKFFSDIFYKNLRYAKVGGLPLEELNYLELQFLLLLDFKLMISMEDLQNYGDLLLKFWKREQLASETNKQEDVLTGDQMS